VLPVQKFLKLPQMIINSQSDIEMAIKIYNTVHPSLHDMEIFRLELDACLRWCSLLLEQNDLKVNISLFHIKFFFIYLIEIPR